MARTNITTVSQIEKFIKKCIKNNEADEANIAGYTGLTLRVRPHQDGKTAKADFRHRYTHRYTGKRHQPTLGYYPAFTLEQARLAYGENDALLQKKIDPLEHREAEKQKEIADRKNTLRAYIDQWKNAQAKRVEQGKLSAKSLGNYFEWVEPIEDKLADMKVKDITAGVVIDFVREVQEQSTYKGKMAKKKLSAILSIALAERVIDVNPTIGINAAIADHHSVERSSLTAPKDFAKLLNDIDQLSDAEHFYNKRILKLLALTFVRINDLCAMKWSDLDFDQGYWIFEQQKSSTRRDMAKHLVVPLSKQTLAILDEMKAITGDYEYVFHNSRRKKAPYHNKHEVNKLLNSPIMNEAGIGENYTTGEGYKGVHCPHGFRSAAKSMLRDMSFDDETTELQLGHNVLNKYGRSYSRMELMDQRTKMMQKWANYIDEIKQGNFSQLIQVDFKGRKLKQG